jgi:hypothetical protein
VPCSHIPDTQSPLKVRSSKHLSRALDCHHAEGGGERYTPGLTQPNVPSSRVPLASQLGSSEPTGGSASARLERRPQLWRLEVRVLRRQHPQPIVMLDNDAG